MITVKRFHDDYAESWNSFVKRSKNATFLFDRKFMGYHKDRFSDHSLMFYENNKLLALFPACEYLQEKRIESHGGLTYGGVLSDRKMHAQLMLDIFDTLIDYYTHLQFRSILYKTIPHIFHNYPAEEDLYALFRNNAELVRVDTSTTICSKNRYTFSGGKKNGVSKAKAHKLTISDVDNAEKFESFYKLLDDTLQTVHQTTATHSAAELKLLKSTFPDNLLSHLVFENHNPIAGVLIFRTGEVAHTQYMACSPRGRATGALDFLLHHLINECYNHIAYFNFGISNEQEGRILNTGLCRQKEMLGGRSTAHLIYKLSLEKQVSHN